MTYSFKDLNLKQLFEVRDALVTLANYDLTDKDLENAVWAELWERQGKAVGSHDLKVSFWQRIRGKFAKTGVKTYPKIG